MNKRGIKAFCLYHLPEPDITPINKRCKTCLEDYGDIHPNNTDCPDFFAYPPIRYEEVRQILDKRNIQLKKGLEIKIIKKIETINRAIIIRHLAGENRNIKINYEEVTEQIIKSLGVLNFTN
mgnify:CR=1 FL=1